MGGVGVQLAKMGRRSGFQTLLKSGQMLVRTNIYLCIAHLRCLNAWTINIDVNIQGCSRNPPTRHPIQIHLSARIVWNQTDIQNILFRYSAAEVRSGLINDRKDEEGIGETVCCNLVDRVALSCAVVSIVLGEEVRTDFGLHKPRGGLNCTPCSGEWAVPGWAERSRLQNNLG
jgi:hypothetical protein